MSSFNDPINPGNDPSEARLRDWGGAERATPPMRRGQFAAVVARLTRGALNTAETPSPWYRPAFVTGGVSLVAVTVAFACLGGNPPRKHLSETVVTSPDASSAAAAETVGVGAARHAASGWDESKLTPYDGGLAVRADPVFLNGETYGASTGYRNSAVVPFTVTVKNDGAAFAGEITVEVGNAQNPDRTFTYPVTIPANATFRTTVYPEITQVTQSDDSRRGYSIHLRKRGLVIPIDAGFVGVNRVYENFYDGRKSLAILDDRLGVLSPRGDSQYARKSGVDYQAAYAKPRNAPERAIGYEAVDVVVLGYGCENLNPAQWTALREWVKDGGSLVLLGGSAKMRRVLATPAALALSPAEQFAAEKRTETPRLKVTHSDIDPLQNGYFDYHGDVARLLPDTLSTIPRAKPDAKVIFLSPMQGKTPWATVGARRTLGAGCVTFYGFDPTVAAYRDNAACLVKWWGDVSQYDKGVLTADHKRLLAGHHPWERGAYENGPTAGQEKYVRDQRARTGDRNPFITQLPDLKLVLYIFLGYFVLVIPVSFVALKQTRRMHYAWFTGPVLAITFAGGLALFTRSLNEASQSVRTLGVLALEAGDGAGRFHGATELYVPEAGKFSLNLPGTQRSFSGSGGYYQNNEATDTLTPEITDDGSEEIPPTVEIANLAFRRFYHSQTMTLGKGITVSLRPDGTEHGGLIGTVDNDTGLTIRNAEIQMRGERTVFRNGATYIPVWRWSGSPITPGKKTITLYPQECRKNTDLSAFHLRAASLPPRTPILTGDVSGETFAPMRFGQWVGGETSVMIIVKLPALRADRIPTYVLTPPSAGGPPPPPTGSGGPTAHGDNHR